MKSQISVIDEPFEISIPCLKLTQPIGVFFNATIEANLLCNITFSDVRRISERDVETYLGIQRPLKPERVKEIAQYVNTVDACFPTAIILAINAKCAEYNEKENCLILRNYSGDEENEGISSTRIAQVLDGQHRIAGLQQYKGPQFSVNVSIFIEMDIESQAYIFSTVNLAQTKVNKNLVYDLFELSKSRSPQKTCHKIAVALNTLEGSPFERRIKRLGTATKGVFTETLSQATFVEALLPYLTADKVVDRDLYKRGRTPKLGDSALLQKQIFRKLFIEERDLEIADIVLNYFEAVAKRWPKAWADLDSVMLSKTNGFKALMRFLKPVYLKLSWRQEIISAEEYQKIFDKIKLSDEDFTIDNFPPGSAGESALFKRLIADSEILAGT